MKKGEHTNPPISLQPPLPLQQSIGTRKRPRRSRLRSSGDRPGDDSRTGQGLRDGNPEDVRQGGEDGREGSHCVVWFDWRWLMDTGVVGLVAGVEKVGGGRDEGRFGFAARLEGGRLRLV